METVETDLDYVLDLVEDFKLQTSDSIGDLIDALEEEETAFHSCDPDAEQDDIDD